VIQQLPCKDIGIRKLDFLISSIGDSLCWGKFMLGKVYAGGSLCWGKFMLGEVYAGPK